MAFAFGHLVSAWIIGLIINKKKKLTQLSWALLLIGSILPDIDFIPDWFLGTNIHRSFTHSILFALTIFLITFLVLKRYKQEKKAIFIGIGIAIHILVDLVTRPGTMIFWPYPYWFSIYGVYPFQLLEPVTTTLLRTKLNWAYLDMGLGVLWLSYLFYKKKLRF